MVKMSPFSILKHYSVQNVTIFIGHSNLSVDRMSLEMDCLTVQRPILSSDIFFYIHDIFWKLFFALLTIREFVIAEYFQL